MQATAFRLAIGLAALAFLGLASQTFLGSEPQESSPLAKQESSQTACLKNEDTLINDCCGESALISCLGYEEENTGAVAVDPILELDLATTPLERRIGLPSEKRDWELLYADATSRDLKFEMDMTQRDLDELAEPIFSALESQGAYEEIDTGGGIWSVPSNSATYDSYSFQRDGVVRKLTIHEQHHPEVYKLYRLRNWLFTVRNARESQEEYVAQLGYGGH